MPNAGIWNVRPCSLIRLRGAVCMRHLNKSNCLRVSSLNDGRKQRESENMIANESGFFIVAKPEGDKWVAAETMAGNCIAEVP